MSKHAQRKTSKRRTYKKKKQQKKRQAPSEFSKHIYDNRDFLSILCRGKCENVKNSILKEATPKLIKSIGECVENVYNGNVKVDPNMKSIINKHAPKLLDTLKYAPLNMQRQVLVQNGGFLPAVLIPALLSVLGGVVGKYL